MSLQLSCICQVFCYSKEKSHTEAELVLPCTRCEYQSCTPLWELHTPAHTLPFFEMLWAPCGKSTFWGRTWKFSKVLCFSDRPWDLWGSNERQAAIAVMSRNAVVRKGDMISWLMIPSLISVWAAVRITKLSCLRSNDSIRPAVPICHGSTRF